jgi:hypothetical protein
MPRYATAHDLFSHRSEFLLTSSGIWVIVSLSKRREQMTKTLTIEALATEIRNSSDKRRRVLNALTETCRFIEKEEPRSADLRPAHIAKLLADYKAHAAYLSAALDLVA